jgi:hypothetical protein
VNTSVVSNTAGVPGGLGGGLHATDTATVILQGVTFANNTAGAGGVLALNTNASLVLCSAARFERNHASELGGGLLLMTGTSFAPKDVARFVVRASNTTALGAGVCAAAKNLQVFNTSGDLDNFVASVDKGGGVLTVVLKVTGAQGMPSDDAVQAALIDSHNKTVLAQVVEGEPGKAVRQVHLKLQQPPGENSLSRQLRCQCEVQCEVSVKLSLKSV